MFLVIKGENLAQGHLLIAFEFASQLSPTFKLYLIKEFERLIRLNDYARKQMEILKNNNRIKELENIDKYLIETK